MGTGVGEAMLISAASGAAMGGAGAALSGQDIMQGVLMGGLMGGATGGIGGALGGAPASAGTAGATAAPGMSTSGAGAALAPEMASAATPMMEMGAGSNAIPNLAGAASNPAVNFMDMVSPGKNPALSGMGMGDRVGNYIVQNPGMAGAMGASLGGMFLSGGPKKEEEDKYDGPLSRFSYSPSTYRPSFAEGGLAGTPEAAAFFGDMPPRQLSGPGDGMSDSIPAHIEGQEPAALADGEFVIPADVVSGLGNGSTDAGAQQLYALMDRVREARTGRAEQGNEINPQEMLSFAEGGEVVKNDRYSDISPMQAYRHGPSGNMGFDEGWTNEAAMEAYTHALMRQIEGAKAAKAAGAAPQGPAPTFDTAAASAGMRETIPGYAESAAYTAGARPGYQEFGPNGQFYQPIYQPTYTDYHNPEGIAALGWGEEWGRDWGRG